MFRFPTCSEARAHAKHLSQTFNLRNSHSQDLVAAMHRCLNWSELKDRFGEPLQSEGLDFCKTLYLEDDSPYEQLEELISPYREAIKQYLKPNRHFTDSLFTQLANKQYRRIAGGTILDLIDEFQDYIKEGGPEIIENILRTIAFREHSLSRVLEDLNVRGKGQWLNPHIEIPFYGISIYGYYRFTGNHVDIEIREFDLRISSPLTRPDNVEEALLWYRNLTRRGWFVPYMVGILRLMVQRVRMAGYKGRIQICKINNVDCRHYHDWYRNKGHIKELYDHGPLFQALHQLNGRLVHKTSDDGFKYHHAIELDILPADSKWMTEGAVL